MILNERYDFDRDAPKDVKAAFKLPPRRVLLKTGEKLWRILTPTEIAALKNPSLSAGRKPDPNELGYWWMTEKTFQRFTEVAERHGQKLSDVVRAGEAISIEFSPKMNALFIVELKRDIFAFDGLAAPQPLSIKDRKVMLIGNAEQVWIPAMSWKHVYVVQFLNSFKTIDVLDLSPGLRVTLGDYLAAQKKR